MQWFLKKNRDNLQTYGVTRSTIDTIFNLLQTIHGGTVGATNRNQEGAMWATLETAEKKNTRNISPEVYHKWPQGSQSIVLSQRQ